jgi:hypothetical protein
VDLDELCRLYPSFQLEDELVIEGGRDVMWGLTYRRRKKEACRETGDGVPDARETRESVPVTKPVPSAPGNSA